MDPALVVVFLAGVVGGGLNAVAGGGTFVTFPALTLVAGVPAVRANATSTVGLWPGAAASVFAYRAELRAARHLRLLSVCSLAGGLTGALLLLWLPSQVFDRLVPFLLLLATVLFAAGPPLGRWLRRRSAAGAADGMPHEHSALVVALVQFAVAVYGGYFGGGLGIMMLAAFGLLELGDVREMNATKTVQQAAVNCMAVATFVLAGAVAWWYALALLGGALVGGYGGASVARRLSDRVIRAVVIGTGLVMSAVFFLRAWA